MEDCAGFVQILEEDGIFIGRFLYPVDIRYVFTVGFCIPCNEAGVTDSIFHSDVLFDTDWNAVLEILARLAIYSGIRNSPKDQRVYQSYGNIHPVPLHEQWPPQP